VSLDRCAIGLVEDDPIMGESLVQRLTLERAKVTWWKTKAQAMEGLSRARPQAVICDIRLPDGSGEEVFLASAGAERAPPFLFVTGYGDIDQAVRLMRQGAGDYITKPFDMEPFLDRLSRMARAENIAIAGALGVSPAISAVEAMLHRLAKVNAPVLITGETGSGKEVCARFMHSLRGCDSGPFMAVNCAAIPGDLMESELFGHERGAFTGAQNRHLGYAERAGTGTLFLDEIGDLAPKLQAKLLRLMEDRSFTRVGGEQAVPFRARIVCATNADLVARVRDGSFREDLYYRIAVVALRVPALRERGDDIPWLLERFLPDSTTTPHERCLKGFSALSIQSALAHGWPGNVRELRNRVERAVALGDGPWIMPGDLFPDIAIEGKNLAGAGLENVREEAERRHIERVLAENDGAILATARALGVSRTTLWEKMKRHGIEPGDRT